MTPTPDAAAYDLLVTAIRRNLAFTLEYARLLVADVPEDQMTAVPAPGLENHPAFVLGHLCTCHDITCQDLGHSPDLPQAIRDLFERKGPSDTRLPADPDDASPYPTKAELLDELARQTARVDDAIALATPAQLGQHLEWRLAHAMPALADVTVFLGIFHSALHLGQLAAWRRGMGMRAALA